MGGFIVDEYYHKFMEYIKYYCNDMPFEEKKMQHFELGLSFDIQKHIKSDRCETLEKMYKRAAQIRNIMRREKEKKKIIVTEERKEMVIQNINATQENHQTKEGNYDSNKHRFQR